MKRRKEIGLIILLNIAILLPIFLIQTKLGHDMNFHLANIDVLANNLNFDSFIHGFTIRPEIANNLGYGIGIFYPMLPHLVGAIVYKLLSVFGISIITSTYLIYFFISVISSLLIYNLAHKLHSNKKIALVSVIIYLIMPYFLGNMFIRFAFNEVFFFMFFLVLLNGLFYFNQNSFKKFYIFFIIGYTGMIFSHLVLSLFASIFFVLFLIINFKKVKDNFKHLLIGIGVVSILVLPNILLLLPHQLSDFYIFNQDGIMTSRELVTGSTVGVNNLLTQYKDYSWEVPIYVPVLIIAFIIISLIYLLTHSKKVSNNYISYILLLFGLSLFMVLSIFPWSIMPEITFMIQFPWRLLGILSIGISLLAPLFLFHFKDRKYFNIIIGIVIVSLFAINIPFTSKLCSRIYKYEGYSINDAMGHQREYLPKDILYADEINNTKVISSDKDVITEVLENDKKFSFKISNIKKSTKVELPKIFYYGYKLKCNKNHYHSVNYSNGYIGSTVNHNGEYKLEYIGTISYIVMRIIRAIFILGTLIYFTIRYLKNKKVMI